MTSLGEQRSLRVGFWLGEASLEYGGIGPYAFRILDAVLTERPPGWKLVLLCSDKATDKIELRVARHADHIEINPIPLAPQGISLRLQQARGAAAWVSSFSKFGQRGRFCWHYMRQWLATLHLDLLHFPTQTLLHPDLQIPYSVTMHEVRPLAPSRLGVPYVITMHDVQELHFPQYFTPAQRAIRAVHYWRALEEASAVIVSFLHIKRDLIRWFGLSPEKIHVCPIPFNSISLAEPTPAASGLYDVKYREWMPFLLYPAHVWPHKNHQHLLRTLKKVKSSGHPDLRLICTGGTSHPCYGEVRTEIEALSLSDSVLFPGIVPEDELRWLYEHTCLVTLPTRYEAGSFPLYEAMLLGVPVICSNVTSLPETIGSARFIFDPQDVEQLSELIVRMLEDDDLQRANRVNSAEQWARLRAVTAGTHFYGAYRSALGLPRPTLPGNC